MVSKDSIDEVKRALSAVVKPEGREFMLDMGKVVHLYSSAIGLITHFHNAITDAKGKLYIVNANEEIQNALCSVNLDKIVPIYPTMFDFELEKGGPEPS
jgi:anti-anti-sigma factor